MNPLLAKGLLLFSCLCLSFTVAAETTQADETIEAGPVEGETLYMDQAPMTCQLTVEKNYNIRQGPNRNQASCSSFRSTSERPFGSYQITVVGQDGNWIRFASEDTANCPGGVGYAYYRAFDQREYNAFRSGACGRAGRDGGRSSTAPAETRASSSNSRGHTFPLDQCYGLKNNGGQGRYGAPRRRGSRQYSHTGTDYYAPRGTPLRSPCEGTVSSSSYGNITGNAVIVTCNNGDTFKFMHMNSSPPKARQGTRVTNGTLIGGVGNTGNASGQATHVHAEAVINGRRVDPQSLWECGGDSGR